MVLSARYPNVDFAKFGGGVVCVEGFLSHHNKLIQKLHVLTLSFWGYFWVGEFTDDPFVFDDVFDGVEIESVW